MLLEFPCEVIGAILAGRWAAAASPLRPWLIGYRLRLAMAVAVTCLVYAFPNNAASLSQHPGSFLLLAVAGLLTSFTSTVMFTAGEHGIPPQLLMCLCLHHTILTST